MTGEAEWKRPVRPDLGSESPFETNPKEIRDLVKRKALEDYLAAEKLERLRHSAATRTSRVRKEQLSWIRRSLEGLYGEDRTKWDELRQIATETIKDPDIANLVNKDFTQRKEPGVWPIGPVTPSAPAGTP